MNKQKQVLSLLLAALLALTGCAARSGGAPRDPSASAPAAQGGSNSTADVPPAQSAPDAPDASAASRPTYIDQVVQETVAKFTEPGMSEFELAKAAFDYMIESTSLADPVGLDLWRIRGNGDPRPSFVENRSLSVLLFGVGMCEDYAAALTMLLRGAGLEAEYVPGLTYSRNGALVDHAWTMVKIDGVWYHLDCQLEDNVSTHGAIRYRYFLRSDATLVGSHRWGRNLIDSGLLTGEQNEEIARDFLYEPCPQDYASPAPRDFTSAPMPDITAIQSSIQAERQEYERLHGPLPPLELDIIPPVFGLDGYGPQDYR